MSFSFRRINRKNKTKNTMPAKGKHYCAFCGLARLDCTSIHGFTPAEKATKALELATALNRATQIRWACRSCLRRVRQSWNAKEKAIVLPSNVAGLGLFLWEDVKKGDTISLYGGKLLDGKKAVALGFSTWKMRSEIRGFLATDGSWGYLTGDTPGLAAFTNAPTRGGKPSAKFVSKGMLGCRLRAERKIKIGEEVFASYGRGYWRHEQVPVSNALAYGRLKMMKKAPELY